MAGVCCSKMLFRGERELGGGVGGISNVRCFPLRQRPGGCDRSSATCVSEAHVLASAGEYV